jgi:hypothetical protein
MMEMIAYCGIDCEECGALHATRENNDQKRTEVAATWSKEYNADIKPEDINCEGCLSEGGTLFNHCFTCDIRQCGRGKGVANCAHCGDYACEKLMDFFGSVPEAKVRLDHVWAELGN